MNRRVLTLALTIGVVALAGVVRAHHSTAMFDTDARVTLTGEIKEFQWTNPHSWIQVVVPDADGTLVEWSIECGSPNTMSRQGWKRSTIMPGDKVSVLGNPMRDGTNAALLVNITLPDGRVLGRVDPPLPTAPGAR